LVKGLKLRLPYIVLTVVLLTVEIIIGAFINDDFVRPYVGDVLVTALLCAMGRIAFPKWNWLPFWVMIFSLAVEIVQKIRLDEILGIEDTVFGIMIGSTFDPNDLVCYSVGVAIFSLTEFILKTKNKTE
jgi:hypothetical protein